MRRRPGQELAGQGRKATAERAERIFRQTDEGAERCVLFPSASGKSLIITRAESKRECPHGITPALFCLNGCNGTPEGGR